MCFSKVTTGLLCPNIRAALGKPLAQITLGDLQGYFSGLESLAPASRARAVNAVKSLFSFAQRIGYLSSIQRPPSSHRRSRTPWPQEFCRKSQVHRLLALEPHPRNRVLLRLMYAAGLRVVRGLRAEMAGLAGAGRGTGQITVYGKGGKTRVVLLSPETWAELISLKGIWGYKMLGWGI